MVRSLEKFLASRIPYAAAKAPCLKKHDEAIAYLLEGFTRWMVAMDHQHGPGYREIIKTTQFDIGRSMAEDIKQEYNLGDDLDSAITMMWMFIVPFGIRMKVTKINKGRIREEKTHCPIYDIFREVGVEYCNELCLSMTSGWLAALSPDLRFEMVRNAGKDHYCIKDIIDTRLVADQKE